MTYSTELKARLEARIKELQDDVVKLTAAVTVLDGNGSQPRAPRRSGTPSPKAAPGYEVVPAGRLSALLTNSDGLSTSELARQTNGASGQILQILKELEQADKVHRSGTRRSTRWHAGARA